VLDKVIAALKSKDYYDKNRDKEIERKRIYRQNNREKIASSDKTYNISHKTERAKLYKEWSKGKTEWERIKSQRRRSLKCLLPTTLTEKQWENIKQYYNNRCAYCGKELPLEQEHFIPLSKGGEYTINNIIPSCKSCNCSKSNKNFFIWYPKYKYYTKERKEIILIFF